MIISVHNNCFVKSMGGSLALNHSCKLDNKEKDSMISSSHNFPGIAALFFLFHTETDSLEIPLQGQYGVFIAQESPSIPNSDIKQFSRIFQC